MSSVCVMKGVIRLSVLILLQYILTAVSSTSRYFIEDLYLEGYRACPIDVCFPAFDHVHHLGSSDFKFIKFQCNVSDPNNHTVIKYTHSNNYPNCDSPNPNITHYIMNTINYQHHYSLHSFNCIGEDNYYELATYFPTQSPQTVRYFPQYYVTNLCLSEPTMNTYTKDSCNNWFAAYRTFSKEGCHDSDVMSVEYYRFISTNMIHYTDKNLTKCISNGTQLTHSDILDTKPGETVMVNLSSFHSDNTQSTVHTEIYVTSPHSVSVRTFIAITMVVLIFILFLLYVNYYTYKIGYSAYGNMAKWIVSLDFTNGINSILFFLRDFVFRLTNFQRKCEDITEKMINMTTTFQNSLASELCGYYDFVQLEILIIYMKYIGEAPKCDDIFNSLMHCFNHISTSQNFMKVYKKQLLIQYKKDINKASNELEVRDLFKLLQFFIKPFDAKCEINYSNIIQTFHSNIDTFDTSSNVYPEIFILIDSDYYNNGNINPYYPLTGLK
eukprot:31969_1